MIKPSGRNQTNYFVGTDRNRSPFQILLIPGGMNPPLFVWR